MGNKILDAKVAKPYAEALYQIGLSLYFKQPNKPDFYNMLFHLQELVKVMEEAPILKNYLTNPLIATKEKKALLKKCVHQDVHSHTYNFLCLLIDKKRIQSLDTICEEFLNKINTFFSIKYVEVISVIELNEEQQSALAEKLAVIFSPLYRERPLIRLKNVVDPDILGGFILKSSSKVSDLSVRGELQRLGKKLGVSVSI